MWGAVFSAWRYYLFGVLVAFGVVLLVLLFFAQTGTSSGGG